MEKYFGLWVEKWFVCHVRGPHLKSIKTNEVGFLGVILHKAHSPTIFLSPVVSSRRQR